MGRCPASACSVVHHLRRHKPPLLDGFTDVANDYEFAKSVEVPVRRTFIEYGCAGDSPGAAPCWTPTRTAPAAIGMSLRCAFDLWIEDVTSAPRASVESDVTYVDGPATLISRSAVALATDVSTTLELAIPCAHGDHTDRTHECQSPRPRAQQVHPGMLYCMTPTSAKASGYYPAGALDNLHAGSTEASNPPEDQGPADSNDHNTYAAALVEAALSAEVAVDDLEVGTVYSSEDLDSEEDRDFVVCVPYSEYATPPSVGSAAHGSGACKRCCFFPKGRCSNGAACQFCHFEHDKRKTKSKNKSKKRRRGKRGGDRGCSPVAPGPQGSGQNSGEQQYVWLPHMVTTEVLTPAFYRT